MLEFRITIAERSERFYAEADYQRGEMSYRWTRSALQKLIRLRFWRRDAGKCGVGQPPFVQSMMRVACSQRAAESIAELDFDRQTAREFAQDLGQT